MLFPLRDEALDGAEAIHVTGNQMGDLEPLTVQYPQIARNRRSDLLTRMAHKDYRPCYEKGRVLSGMQTLPFGYREEEEEQNGARQQQHQHGMGMAGNNPINVPSRVREEQPQQQQIDLNELGLAAMPGSSNWSAQDYVQRYI